MRRSRCRSGLPTISARKLVALADQKMYEAKRTFAGSAEPHITQANVRITGGKLVNM